MSITSIVAENIRGFRKKLRYSQFDLAELSGLHHTYIGNIERSESNVTLVNVEKIATALKVPVHYLLVKDSYKTETGGSALKQKTKVRGTEILPPLTAFVVSGLERLHPTKNWKNDQKKYVAAVERELYSTTGISLSRITKFLKVKPFMLLMEETASHSKKRKR